jgi:3-deoxy-D-manno-octulosonic-acid transferase
MRFHLALILYRLLLPLLFIVAFPGWILKMIRRGGFGTRLGERAAIYTTPLDHEPCGAIHVHAISVGEALIALKLLREWQRVDPDQKFVLAVGTATGHAVATEAGLENLRITYSPLDFPGMVRRYLNRFEPSQIVLIEGEIWPGMLRACRSRNIPVRLVNARLSPRSARRYRKFKNWLAPLFGQLDLAALQENGDAAIWQDLGVSPEKIHVTGSIKFDPGSGPVPALRPDFQNLLDAFGARPVVLVASTHIGEEAWIAEAIRAAAPHALIAIVPRHAERRAEVKADLEKSGFDVILRSAFQPPKNPATACFVIDSTGELRDWTAHADAVIIGKSFLAIGGQNPAEAILAHKPVIFGPHMENFEPLVSRLIAAEGCLRTPDQAELSAAVRQSLDPVIAKQLTFAAFSVLNHHQGATSRVVSLLRGVSF